MNSNLHWNLSGPAGAIDNNAYFRAFSSTDGNYAPLDLGPRRLRGRTIRLESALDSQNNSPVSLSPVSQS